LRIIGQIGTTIGLGLLFDTLVVRSFMTPSIAALLGRWFWWPQRVRPRPASALLEPVGPRWAARRYLLGEERSGLLGEERRRDEDPVTTPIPGAPG
jgi:RND superfamily putative drug exporter